MGDLPDFQRLAEWDREAVKRGRGGLSCKSCCFSENAPRIEASEPLVCRRRAPTGSFIGYNFPVRTGITSEHSLFPPVDVDDFCWEFYPIWELEQYMERGDG